MTLDPNPLISVSNTALHPLNELDSNLPPTFSAAGQVLKVSATAISNRLTLISSVLGLSDSDLFSGTNSKQPTPLGWSILRRMPAKGQSAWLDSEARVLFSKWLPQPADDVLPVEVLDTEPMLDDGLNALVEVIDYKTAALARRSKVSHIAPISFTIDLDNFVESLDNFVESLADDMYQQGFNAGMELAEIFAEGFNQGIEKGMQDIQERLQSLGKPTE